MINKAALEMLEANERRTALEALALLGQTRLIKSQQELLFAQLAVGSDSEDGSELAKQILVYRAKDHLLTEFAEFCDSARKELNK